MSPLLREQVPFPLLKLLLVDLPAGISFLENVQRGVFTMTEPLPHQPSGDEEAAEDQDGPEEHHAQKAEAHHGHPAAICESVHHVKSFRR
jgi:hypothetical protein